VTVATKKKKAAKSKTAALKKSADEKVTVDYRSLTGHNYVNVETENEVRVEAGDKIPAGTMSLSAVNHELRDDKIEEWEPRKTEDVIHPEDNDSEVHGVKARHEDGELAVKEVNQ
jgi:hypothetical protein